MKLLDLRPTQLAIGLKEVDAKISKLKELSHHDLGEHLEKNPVPAVRGPDGEFYIIDHHHMVRACWEMGHEKVNIQQQTDLSHLSENEFWTKMEKLHWAFLHDQFGNGPHPPNLLPHDIRGLADDPYRSLAWAARLAGGFEKTDIPFAEFQWANLFREHFILKPGDKAFEKSLKAALELCRSDKAKHLPGFLKQKTPIIK